MVIRSRKKVYSRGFSLVELLVVISVIALIATISIPQVSKILESGDEIQNKRNALTIAQVAAAAQAAGNQTIEAAADLDAAVTALVNTTTGAGPMDDVTFSVSSIAPEEITDAKVYLAFVNGTIRYVP